MLICLSRQGVLFQQIYIKPSFFNGAQNHRQGVAQHNMRGYLIHPLSSVSHDHQQELRNFQAHPDTGWIR